MDNVCNACQQPVDLVWNSRTGASGGSKYCFAHPERGHLHTVDNDNMTQPTLPPDRAGTVSMFSLTDSLGINANAWPDLLNSLESRPDAALLAIGEMRDALDKLEANAVVRLRSGTSGRYGKPLSWARIAALLGVTRQAAQKRYPEVA